MSTIYISYSSQDRAAAEALRAWLRDQGYVSVFLDVDPEQGVPAGRSWERELYAALESSLAVVALCSRASMSSPWCFHEIASARARGIPVFPVRLDDCPLIDLLRDQQTTDLFPDREQGLVSLSRGMLLAGLDPATIFAWNRGQSPYPGLSAFGAEHAAVYFGREGAIREVLAELDRRSRQGAGRVVLILGASGSGKTSLMRAGVLPRLARDPERWLVLQPFAPLGDPIPRLAAVLVEAARETDRPLELHRTAAELAEAAGVAPPDPSCLAGLVDGLRLAQGRPAATVVLALDEIEQLLAMSPASKAPAFLAMLRAVLEQRDSRLVLLGTLRSDHLAAWHEHPALQGVSFGAVAVGAMPPEGFRQIIEIPARVHGLELEPGLVEVIVADVGGNPNSLPLLAYTLRELYETYGRSRGRIDVADYRDGLGGIARSIEERAETLYAAIAPDADLEQRLRLFFIGLAVLTDDGNYVRRSLPWSAVDPSLITIAERYVAAGLLASDRRDAEATPVVMVSHEALFRVWRRLRAWLAEVRQHHAAAEHIRRMQRRWLEVGAPPDDLLLRPGQELEEARELLAARDVLIDDLRAYIDASIAAVDRLREFANAAAAGPKPHVFLSYVREDAEAVERLAAALAAHGIGIWIDRHQIKPGERWQKAIGDAIRSGALFVACFSQAYSAKSRSYMNEEILLAIEEIRLRPDESSWFVPIRLDDCEIPDRRIGPELSVRSYQWLDMFPDWERSVERLSATCKGTIVLASGGLGDE